MGEVVIQSIGVFAPLYRPARYKGVFGGRGSGKSRFFARLMVLRARTEPGFRAICLREVQKSLAGSSMQLLRDEIERTGSPGFRVLRDRIQTPGGGEVLFQGLQDHTADSVKSLEGVQVAWIEEAQTLSAYSLELLRPTIRAPGSEIWASWNPRSADDPIDQLLRGPNPPADAIVVRADYMDNPRFPPELEAERQRDQVANPHRYAHIWEGAYEPHAFGALWDYGILHKHRSVKPPELSRVVIAIDPAVSVSAHADETGIVAVGVGQHDRIAYVLEDASGKFQPAEWARRAIALFDKWGADAIVAERNQGGDMIRATLAAVRNGLPVIEVTATRGKHVRAEPIAALYAEGRVSHAGTFPELEAQMVQITPDGYVGVGSPDRADALVWAVTELQKGAMRSRPVPAASRKTVVKQHWAG